MTILSLSKFIDHTPSSLGSFRNVLSDLSSLIVDVVHERDTDCDKILDVYTTK